MRPRSPTTSLTLGFTLIELLVVIAIVAILSSLLLTGIKQVRTAAWNASCGSNQRSLVTAMLAYTMDYDGLLPYRLGNSEWWERMTDQLDEQYHSGYAQFRRDICHCPFVDREISNPWKFWDRFSTH
jgi:prepilin-type N-terminal cleavage/methylation domain-containing protein